MRIVRRTKPWTTKPLDCGSSFPVSDAIMVNFRDAFSYSSCSRCIYSLVMETQYSGDTVLLVFPDGTGPALLSAMIAGIPYNRVHELNYGPAEVRLDITMDSTKALLKSGALTEDYKTILAEGRQELKRLRSLKPEDVVSVKDKKLEEDRLEMEAYANQVEKKRRVKDEQDRKAREARAREIEDDRQRRREEKGLNANEGDTIFPVLLGAGALGAAGAVSLFGGEENDEKETLVSGEKGVEITNATAILLPGPGLDVETVKRQVGDILDIRGGPFRHVDNDFRPPTFVASRNETRGYVPFGSNYEGTPDASTQRVNGDRLATFSAPTKTRDPVKVAEEAMKEYLEMDDGGSEWLLMISDIMHEEDDIDGQSRGLSP